MPMTPQARVYHQVTQISPQINGPINEVLVKNNQTVKEGQVLFIIDETPYLIALEKAQIDFGKCGVRECSDRCESGSD